MRHEFGIDVQRTCLQRSFFQVFAFDSTEELIAAVSDMEVGLETIAMSHDARDFVYSGWVYWFLFLKGYLQFSGRGELGNDNIYVDYLFRFYARRRHDPGRVAELSDLEGARDRAKTRYGFFRFFEQVMESGPGDPKDLARVTVVVTEPPPEHPLRVFPIGATDSIGAALVDGWHRLFVARLVGIQALPGVVMRADEQAVASGGS